MRLSILFIPVTWKNCSEISTIQNISARTARILNYRCKLAEIHTNFVIETAYNFNILQDFYCLKIFLILHKFKNTKNFFKIWLLSSKNTEKFVLQDTKTFLNKEHKLKKFFYRKFMASSEMQYAFCNLKRIQRRRKELNSRQNAWRQLEINLQ